MGAIKYTTSMVLTGLFIIAVIGFALSFANNNDVYVSLGDDTEFSEAQRDAIGNISAFRSSSEDISESYFSTQAESGDEVSSSGNQFKASLNDVKGIATTSIGLGYRKIFGQDEGFGIFLTALLGMLVFVGMMYGYKAWFGRNPD